MPALGLTDEYNLTAARGVVAGAKAAALLTRSNARACLMAGVAALQAICRTQRVCDASLLSELCVQGGATTQSFCKHACVEASVLHHASWQNLPVHRNNTFRLN